MALTELQKIEKQMADLLNKKEELLNSTKNDAVSDINKILEKTGFTIPDLFPEFKKGFKGTRTKTLVKIGNEELEISGKITKDIQQALRNIGLNPNDYDKKKVVEEFVVS